MFPTHKNLFACKCCELARISNRAVKRKIRLKSVSNLIYRRCELVRQCCSQCTINLKKGVNIKDERV